MDDDRTDLREREFLRIPTSIPIEVAYLTKDGRTSEGIWVEGEMPEIGGGGARIETPLEMNAGDAVTLRFKLPDTDGEMRLYARVVEVPRGAEPNRACVKFVGIRESERGTILRFLFREQIRSAKDAARRGTASSGDKRGHQGTD